METISFPTKTTRFGRSAGSGLNSFVSTPGGPRRVFSLRPATSGSASQRDSAVWREPTRTPDAASMPSLAYGRKRGFGLTVYSRAEPWTLAAKGPMLGAGEDRWAHDQVVGQSCVDSTCCFCNVPHGRDVGLDVAVQLFVGELREGLDLEALVGVLDIDREEAVDVGVVDLDPLQLDLAVLAEEMDLVAEPGQGLGEVGVVDVAAGAAQHVAVEDENTHRCRSSY